MLEPREWAGNLSFLLRFPRPRVDLIDSEVTVVLMSSQKSLPVCVAWANGTFESAVVPALAASRANSVARSP